MNYMIQEIQHENITQDGKYNAINGCEIMTDGNDAMMGLTQWRPNVYFATPITDATEQDRYRAEVIVRALKKRCNVLTEHFVRPDLKEFDAKNAQNGVNIPERDFSWLHNCDFLVGDYTNSSTGTGMEFLANLGVLSHPALVLHERGDPMSKMVSQFQHPLMTLRDFSSQRELETLVQQYADGFLQQHRLFPNFAMIDAGDGGGKGVFYAAIKEWGVEQGLRPFDMLEYWKHIDYIPSWDELQRLAPGTDMLLLAEPTYAGVGKQVRDEITNKTRNAIRPYDVRAIAQGFSLDRDILYKRLVIDALDSGAYVVSDRGVITSDVYQPVDAETRGYGKEFFRLLVRGLPGNQQAFNHSPGVFFVPRVPTEERMRRLNSRDGKNDDSIFETGSFQERISLEYDTPSLRSWYERRGSTFVYLDVPAGETPDVTKVRARAAWEEYVAAR